MIVAIKTIVTIVSLVFFISINEQLCLLFQDDKSNLL